MDSTLKEELQHFKTLLSFEWEIENKSQAESYNFLTHRVYGVLKHCNKSAKKTFSLTTRCNRQNDSNLKKNSNF